MIIRSLRRACFSALFLVLVVMGVRIIVPHSQDAHAAGPQTWFVRPDGGTRYDANTPTGQCDGLANVAYPGSGVDQHCAFNDFRYLYGDDAAGNTNWIIAGGDTVVVYGCTALPTQANPSNPDCRIGWDQGNGNSSQNEWCAYNYQPWGCSIPPIPSGTASQPTKILGACAYGTYTCNPVNAYPYTSDNLAQLYGGFALGTVFDLNGSQYVDLEGLEITSHNDGCTRVGYPGYPKSCNTDINSGPLDDFGQQGIGTNNTTANILLQDIYVHGFTGAGIGGPIGGTFTLNRVSIDFNAFAGWNFDDGYSTPDAPGSTITQNYVSMVGNGCLEQYPIVNTRFPAVGCWDTNDAGFGDSWSGQNTELSSFTCDHCYIVDNVKDAALGPHTLLDYLKLTDSVFAGNMGQQGKWGMEPNSTAVIEDNLIIGNCTRMSAQLPGAAQNFAESTGLPGSYLTGFCRAAGDVFAYFSAPGGTTLFAGNTLIAVSPTIFDLGCQTPGGCATAAYNFEDNLFLGYGNDGSYYPGNGEAPGLYYFSDTSDRVNSSHNLEYGVRNGAPCDGNATTWITSVGDICSNPLITNEPAQGAWPPESALDTFLSNFSPSASSPALGAGIAISGLTTDFNGATRGSTPTIGAIEVAGSGGSTPPPSDTTPPSVPTNLSVSSVTQSTVSLSWSASTDNVGVSGYYIYRNGTKVGTTGATSYTDSGLTASTGYTYTVSAFDSAGNVSSRSGSVTGTTSASSGGGTPTSTPSSTNPTGPSGYAFCALENTQCSFNGTMSVAFGAGSSFIYQTLTGGVLCANSVFTDPDVGASKACFTKPTSSPGTPTSTPDTTPPTTAVTSPANNASLSGVIAITASASDNVGVTSVAFFVDGTLLGTDNTAPYTYNLNTLNLSNGTHLISTKAYDLASNTGVSPTVPVIVANTTTSGGGGGSSGGGGTTSGGGGGGGGGTTPSTPTAPSFSITSVSVGSVTNNAAKVTVTTHAPASIVIQYGRTTSYGMATAPSPSLSTNYVSLAGLAPNTVYDFIVIATPPGGTSFRSSVYTFQTSATPGAATSTTPSAPTFTENFSYGDTNSEIAVLQNILKSQGFLPSTIPSTGYFGTQTEHALLLFQNAHDLNKSGFVDQQTEVLLNKVAGAGTAQTTTSQTTTQPTTTTASGSTGSSSGSLAENLGPGSTGSQVTILQHILANDGDYTAGIFSTYYGSLTEAAVKAFQSKYGIISYGSPTTTGYGAVGPKTRVRANGL